MRSRWNIPYPKPANQMLGRYLAVFRPRLCRQENTWLFPGALNGHKTKGTLSGQIIDRIVKAIGIINFYIGLETADAVRKFSAMALEDVTWKLAS
jgi:hypothetical protein